jgi:uncharacterized Zn finger protein (UPF0148 family)
MTGAWGDDMVDMDRDDSGDVYVDWQQRGHFKCPHCERVLTTLGGVKSHVEAVHSEDAAAFRSRLKSQERERHRVAKEASDAEKRRLSERNARKVILSTSDIDEITAEIESLIDMMEPYWSQGDCAKDARALIDRLNALADGREGGAA